MYLPYSLFIFTLIFAPLAFGSVEYWSIGIVKALVPAALLVCCAVQSTIQKNAVQVPGLLPLTLLLCWMALQLIPLPPLIVQVIAPEIFDIYKPLLEISDQGQWIPLTVQPKASLLELLRFSTYGLFYILTIQLLRRRNYLQKTVQIVAWLGVAIAVEAIIQKLTSPHAIYWFRTSPQTNFPFGPWVYSNHFAGFMAMIFPVVLALFLYYRPTYTDHEPLRAKVLALFTMPGTNRYLLFGFGAVMIGVSILLSASRGGIVTLCLTLSFFIFFFSSLTGQWRNKWALFLVILMLLIISWLGSGVIIGKFADIWGAHGINTSERLPVLLDSLKMIRDFFVTGSGFGTYEVAFPAYRTVPGEMIVFDHAHNDYIELMATGGLIGFLLTGWFVITVINHALNMLRKRRERYNQLLTIAALTSIIALLLHSVIDFQMYNGANGLYFFFFCGLTVSAANTRLHHHSSSTLLPAAPRQQQVITAALAVIILSSSLWYTLSEFKARRTYAPIRSIYLNSNIPAQRLQDIYLRSAAAARLDPLEARYFFTMAAVSTLLNNPEQSLNKYLHAARLNPLSAQLIQQLALTLPIDQGRAADTLLALGCKYEPLFLNYSLTYANWLISSNNKPKAMSVIRQALIEHPRWAAKLTNFIFSHSLSRSDISSLLPPQPQAWYAAGSIMEREGHLDEAEYYYLQTLQYLENYPALPTYFSRLYNLYMRQKKYEKALAILRQGIKHLPNNSQFHRQLGDSYRKQGINYRAIEEYQIALQLNPNDTGLKRQLDVLQGENKHQQP